MARFMVKRDAYVCGMPYGTGEIVELEYDPGRNIIPPEEDFELVRPRVEILPEEEADY